MSLQWHGAHVSRCGLCVMRMIDVSECHSLMCVMGHLVIDRGVLRLVGLCVMGLGVVG